MNFWWLLVVPAYLIGSFSSARLVGKKFGADPTTMGSKNPGATNVYRLSGYKAGLIVLLIDILKALLPTLLVWLFLDDRTLATAVGMAAVAGHMFPPLLKFKGGKGVASLGGYTIILNPIVALSAFAIWLAVIFTTKKSSVGAIIAGPSLVLGVWLRGRPVWEIACMGGVFLVILFQHRENMMRLIKRTEGNLYNDRHSGDT